jgi:hypothetical protein
MSHEPGHGGMFLVFRNNQLPYAVDDEVNEEKFREVIRECERLKQHEPIVEWVFEYEKDRWPVELIVRVPHMLAHHQDDRPKLDELKATFKGLFKYYEDVVVPAMVAALPVLEKLSNESAEVKFSCLTEPLKAAILNSQVKLQGHQVKLKNVANQRVLELLTKIQIREILDVQKLVIGKQPEICKDFFMQRSFIELDFKGRIWEWNYYSQMNELTEEAATVVQDFDSVMAAAGLSKLFLLSDHAGAGKSTTMRQLAVRIKEKLPDHWVSCIDLKRHLKVFEEHKDVNFDAVDTLHKILLQILALTDSLESSVFIHLFEANQVVLLFDGVDEIAPKFKDFFIKLITSIKSLTRNQQWIATRPQHTEELKMKLNHPAHGLLSFNELQVRNFIDGFLRSKNIPDKLQLLDSCIEVTKRLNIIENPLMLTMVAELHAAGKLSSSTFNRFSLYKAMVELKREIRAGRGEIVNRDSDIDSTVNLWDVYRVYALKLFLNDGTFEDFMSDGYLESEDRYGTYPKEFVAIDSFQLIKKWQKAKSKWSPEAIARNGFLIVDHWGEDGEFPDFGHRTFAEFFAAQFIVETVREAVEDGDELKKTEFEVRMKLAVYVLREHSTNNDRTSISGVCEFISDYFSIELKELEMSEKFEEFCERGEMKRFLTKLLRVVHYEEPFVTFILRLLRVSNFNSRVLKALTMCHNGRAQLFQTVFDKAYALSCVDLFDIFKHSNVENWHSLTGFGLHLNQEQLKLPKIADFKLFRDDFLLNCELIADHDGKERIYDKNDEENVHQIALIYQFFCFINGVDDIPLEGLEKFMSGFARKFNLLTFRSRYIIKVIFEMGMRHFQTAKKKFNEFSSNISSQFVRNLIKQDINKIDRKLIANFSFFYEHVEIFNNFDRDLMKDAFSIFGDILLFAVLAKVEILQSCVQKYFNADEIQLILVKALLECLQLENADENIRAFDAFAGKISEFSTIFQFIFCFSDNFHDIPAIVDKYRNVFIKDWHVWAMGRKSLRKVPKVKTTRR